MSEPNARDYTIALADAFAILVRELDKAESVVAADVLKAMNKKADSRRLEGDALVAEALANIGGKIMSGN